MSAPKPLGQAEAPRMTADRGRPSRTLARVMTGMTKRSDQQIALGRCPARDGDAKFGRRVSKKLYAMGINELVTAPALPWQNAYVERLIGSIRRELSENVVVLNEQHLRRLPLSYMAYYNEWQTHRSLDGDAPYLRPVRLAEPARVSEFSAVSGLHRYYLPEAA